MQADVGGCCCFGCGGVCFCGVFALAGCGIAVCGRPGNKGFRCRLGRFSRCEGGRDAFRSAAALPAQSTEPASSVSGMRALVDIPAGSQLCGTFLAGSGSDGRLAAQLSADKEAVSLSVDDETGIAGQVKPYDAVRVVSIEGASSGIVDSQTLANRARVVAVGGDGYNDGASYSAIVIEVSPDEADAIRQAQVSGKVSVQLLASEDVLTGGVDG